MNISNVREFIEWLDDQKLHYGSHRLHFRGQASCNWDNFPSVFRKDYNERELILSAVNENWSEFSSYRTSLEKLIVLQHNGLPTRLLDVTYNPLVALYFSCCEGADNGCVTMGFADVDEESFEAVSKLTDLLFMEKLLYSDIINSPNVLNKLKEVFAYNFTIDHLTESHFVRAPYNNPRIMAQNGGFIVFPLFNKELRISERSDIEAYNQNLGVLPPKVIINHDAKENILEELDILGINEGTLFPELSHRLSAVKKRQLLKIKKMNK